MLGAFLSIQNPDRSGFQNYSIGVQPAIDVMMPQVRYAQVKNIVIQQVRLNFEWT